VGAPRILAQRRRLGKTSRQSSADFRRVLAEFRLGVREVALKD
jgi:hypothetical protein